MHFQMFDFLGGKESNLVRLFTCPYFSANNCTIETDRELLTHLTVRKCDDVFGISINANNIFRFYVQSGFFFDLSHNSFSNTLTNVHCSSWHRPYIIITTPMQKDFSLVVATNAQPDRTILLGFGAFASFELYKPAIIPAYLSGFVGA